MNLGSALALALKLLAAWGVVEDLKAGEFGELQAIRLRIAGGYWELGPLPVRRLQ